MAIRTNQDIIVTITSSDNTKSMFSETIKEEHCLDVSKPNVFDIFKEYNQKITLPKQPSKSLTKNFLGQMPYVLIAEDENSNPIYISKIEYEGIQSVPNDTSEVLKTFRFAVSAVKE